MYLLNCPDCQSELKITPAQAGDVVRCPKCQSQVAVPKLGELRQLPRSEEPDTLPPARARSEGGGLVFVGCTLIAVGCFLAAGYNGIRWAMVDADMTTEGHLEEIERSYSESEPAAMILEFADMENYSLDLVSPYTYQIRVDEKRKWALNALVGGGIGLLFLMGGFVGASQSRNSPAD